jgi:hypothetical protein
MILQRVEIYVIALDCVVWNKEDVHDFVRGVHLSERTQGLPSRRGHASLKQVNESFASTTGLLSSCKQC